VIFIQSTGSPILSYLYFAIYGSRTISLIFKFVITFRVSCLLFAITCDCSVFCHDLYDRSM
jgi:hypothetical protein